jgi:hypothetical protein
LSITPVDIALLPMITDLALDNMDLTDRQMEALGAYIRLTPVLKRLSCRGHCGTVLGLGSLGAALQHNASVKRLDVSGGRSEKKGMSMLVRNLECNRGLEELILNTDMHTETVISGCWLARLLEKHPVLKRLEVAGYMMEKRNFMAVVEAIPTAKALTALNLSHVRFVPDVLRALFMTMTTEAVLLSELDISGTQTLLWDTSVFLAFQAMLMSNLRLKTLRIRGGPLPEKALWQLMAVAGIHPALRVVDIDQLDDAHAAVWGAFNQNM